MKKIYLLALSLISLGAVQAQNEKEGFMEDGKSLFEEVSGLKKKSDKFNLYLNMQGSFDAKEGFPGERSGGSFNMRQFRIEAKGQVNSWLSYRWRQRLNRSNDGGGMLDNMPTSIDIAGIGLNLSEKFSMFIGKQCAAYGGIEFDLNPIAIYEYSDMIENMSNFLTGVNFGYQLKPTQQLNFQILNSRNNRSATAFYGQSIEDARLPLLYTLNWNGNFNNTFFTRWSASYMSQAKDNEMFYIALGNQLNLGKFDGFFDFMYSKEDLDRKGVIYGMRNGADEGINPGAEYMSFVLKLNYHITPSWNLFVKGMYETASMPKQEASEGGVAPEKGKYRTSLGYLGGVEYYPMKDGNLHFFLTYIGRSYKFTDRAETLSNLENYNTNRVSVGFVYQLPVF